MEYCHSTRIRRSAFPRRAHPNHHRPYSKRTLPCVAAPSRCYWCWAAATTSSQPAATSVAHATDVTLLEDSAVHATVVIADQPSEVERHAAQLLCRYLSWMAGNVSPPAPVHTSEWQHAAGTSAVLVGSLDTHAEIQSLVADNRLTLSSRDPGGDGLVIQTTQVDQQQLLVLTGSSHRAVLHSVVHFLEQ